MCSGLSLSDLTASTATPPTSHVQPSRERQNRPQGDPGQMVREAAARCHYGDHF